MLNVHELERRWLRYKIRRYLPLAVGSVTLIILIPTALVLWPESTANTQQSAAVNSLQNSLEPASKTDPETSAQTIPTTKPGTATPEASKTAASDALQPLQHTVLEPSLGFIQTMEEQAVASYGAEPNDPIVVEEQVPEPVATIMQVPSQSLVIAADPSVSTPVNKPETLPSTVSITPKEANDLNDVIKRFKTNKNPALSLFLARRYYDIQDYSSAYDYALKTNELNSEIEESWLIFAKSLVKLGQKEQALKVLKSYINHSNSIPAKGLFEEIRTGKFQ